MKLPPPRFAGRGAAADGFALVIGPTTPPLSGAELGISRMGLYKKLHKCGFI